MYISLYGSTVYYIIEIYYKYVHISVWYHCVCITYLWIQYKCVHISVWYNCVLQFTYSKNTTGIYIFLYLCLYYILNTSLYIFLYGTTVYYTISGTLQVCTYFRMAQPFILNLRYTTSVCVFCTWYNCVCITYSRIHKYVHISVWYNCGCIT